MKRAVLDYEHGVASCTDPKRFWKYVRTKQKSHPRIGPLYVSESGSLTDDPKECAQLFAEEYASYFCGSDKSAPIPVLQTQATLTSISFSPTLLQTQLNRMRSFASPGPDGITHLMLKSGGTFLLHQLNIFFQYCFDNGVTPSQWKLAFVVPIYKKGNCTLLVNYYRPVSLTSCVAKLMKACVREKSLTFWRTNSVIHPFQFGFIPDSSCCT